MTESKYAKEIAALANPAAPEENLANYFSLNFSVFCSIINLKMVAVLTEKTTDSQGGAEDLIDTILRGWKAGAEEMIRQELVIFDEIKEEPFATAMFGTLLGSKEELQKKYMKALDVFYNGIVDATKNRLPETK